MLSVLSNQEKCKEDHRPYACQIAKHTKSPRMYILDKDVGTQQLSHTVLLGGILNWCNHFENQNSKSSKDGDVPATMPRIVQVEMCSLKNFLLGALDSWE